MLGGAPSQLLATLVLPIIAGFICMLVVILRTPNRGQTAVYKNSKPVAKLPSDTLGVLSVADAYDCDRNILWETQVIALQRIGAHATIPELYNFWEHYSQRYPELYEETSCWDWLTFLQNCDLAESNNSVVRLTANGRDFLNFLVCNAKLSRVK